uniref:Uncharacterized protein n=1 Tax=Anguilla anguilla TaxID=7936 RepID=A0A0E9WNN4_ANGAN
MIVKMNSFQVKKNKENIGVSKYITYPTSQSQRADLFFNAKVQATKKNN